MTRLGAHRVLCGLAALFLAASTLGAYFLYEAEHHLVVAVMLAQGVLYAAIAWWVVKRAAARWRAVRPCC